MGYPWNWVSAEGSEENRMVRLRDGRKSFKLGFAVLIQYRRLTESQPATQPDSYPATQPRRHSKYALCISASRSNDIIQLKKHSGKPRLDSLDSKNA